MANYVKFMRGTTAAYNKLCEAGKTDINTLYFLSDSDDKEGALYLGTKLIAGPDSEFGPILSLNDLADVVVDEELNYDALLIYSPEENAWRNFSFEALIFGQDRSGFVPGPTNAERNLFLRGDGTWAHTGVDNQIFDAIEPKANQSHGDALAAATSDFILNDGDIAIVKDYIARDANDTSKFQYTSYVRKGDKWCAMDGNYNAENVYFSNDFIFTESVGTIKIPESGSQVVAAAGKNIKELFEGLFSKEREPEVVNPYLILDTPNNMSYEVGTEVIPTYMGDFNSGSYEFGPATQVEASNWVATNSNSEIIKSQDGQFETITVKDDTYYWIKLQAELSDGVVPYTNLGKHSTKTPAIKKATYSITSPSVITGYRKGFWGVLNNKEELTSDIIRSLNTKNNALVDGSTFTIDIPESTIDNKIYRVVIAYPSSLRELTAVLDENDSNTNIVSGFDSMYMNIKSANNYDETEYRVYVLDFAEPYNSNNKFKVTI